MYSVANQQCISVYPFRFSDFTLPECEDMLTEVESDRTVFLNDAGTVPTEGNGSLVRILRSIKNQDAAILSTVLYSGYQLITYNLLRWTLEYTRRNPLLKVSIPITTVLAILFDRHQSCKITVPSIRDPSFTSYSYPPYLIYPTSLIIFQHVSLSFLKQVSPSYVLFSFYYFPLLQCCIDSFPFFQGHSRLLEPVPLSRVRLHCHRRRRRKSPL